MALAPLDLAVPANSDASGNVTWTANFLGMGEAAVVSLYVPGAPKTAGGIVYVAGTPQLNIGLAVGLSGLRIQQGPLKVVASGFAPSTAYQLTIKGAYGPNDEVPPTAPLPSPAASVSVVPPFAGLTLSRTLTLTGGNDTFPAAALALGIIVYALSTNAGTAAVDTVAGLGASSAVVEAGMGIVLPPPASGNANGYAAQGTSGDKLSLWGA